MKSDYSGLNDEDLEAMCGIFSNHIYDALRIGNDFPEYARGYFIIHEAVRDEFNKRGLEPNVRLIELKQVTNEKFEDLLKEEGEQK